MEYYTHTCKCGCGGQIEIKEYHKWKGIPEYIHNHHTKGKKLRSRTKEERQKMSISLKGQKRTEKQKENYSKSKKGVKRKPFTEKHRQNLSISLMGDKNPMYGRTKELSPQWLGGSSFLPYPPEFNKEKKQFIKNRDLNICQTPNCMNTENLCIHHIDYDKKNNNPENLITLCNNCHAKTNFYRDYWIEYYKEIVSIYL